MAGLQGATSGSSDLPAIPASYVFIKSNQFGLIENGKIALRQNVNLNGFLWRDGYSWSNSGRYFAFFNSNPMYAEEYEGRSIYVIDIRTKEVSSILCPRCTGLTPSDSDKFIVAKVEKFESPAVLYQVDLGSADRVFVPVTVAMPEEVEEFELVAGTSKSVLLLARMTGVKTSKNLYLTGSGRQTMALMNSSSQTFRITARASAKHVNLEKIAVNVTATGVCAANSQVIVIDATSGRVDRTDTSAVVPPERLGEKGFSFDAQDLWWGRGGMLYGSFYTWNCEDGFPSSSTTSTHIYKLEGNRWVKVSDTPLISQLELGQGVGAFIAPTNDPLEFHNMGIPVEGVLYHRIGDKETRLATNVFAILAPW
ncbi:hypothetical protein [Amycolatopsis sp. lyj-90]|uniref:hypothetical protein n=1 Tax=Amycolatopsis sp. lyj-90 TaxID=2789285 RepID=UPI00397B328A